MILVSPLQASLNWGSLGIKFYCLYSSSLIPFLLVRGIPIFGMCPSPTPRASKYHKISSCQISPSFLDSSPEGWCINMLQFPWFMRLFQQPNFLSPPRRHLVPFWFPIWSPT
jgi:hypothetical protein